MLVLNICSILNANVLAYLQDNSKSIEEGYYDKLGEAIQYAYTMGKTDAATGADITNVKVTFHYKHTHGRYCYPDAYLVRDGSREYEDEEGPHTYVWGHCSVCGQGFGSHGHTNLKWYDLEAQMAQHAPGGKCTKNGYTCGKTEGEQTTTDSSTLGAGDTVTSAVIIY